MKGIDLIREEREKQIVKHGYDRKHDLSRRNKELLFGALSYLKAAIYGTAIGRKDWPFEGIYWHPEGYIDCLKKAGAFIAAELDRIETD